MGKSYNYHGVSPQSVNITGFTHNIHRVSLWFWQPFSIDRAGKTCRHPVMPCKHLQGSKHFCLLYKSKLNSTNEIHGLWTARLAQNQTKWYRYTWTGISVESIWAFARPILLTFTMTIARGSWITLNYN